MVSAPSTARAAAASGLRAASMPMPPHVRALTVASGVCGVVGTALLAAFFAFADPFTTSGGPWHWAGRANDVVGSLAWFLLIPAVAWFAFVLRDVLVRVWSALTVVGLAAMAVAGPLLVREQITLDDQYAVSAVGLPLVVGWVWLVSRRGARWGAIGGVAAATGRATVLVFVLGAVVGLAGLALLPWGSPALVVALVPGVLGWVALTAWPLVLGIRPPTVDAAVRALMNQLTRACIAGYRATGGRFMGRAKGAPVLLLTTTGRRSGLVRSVAVVFAEVDDALRGDGDERRPGRAPGVVLQPRRGPRCGRRDRPAGPGGPGAGASERRLRRRPHGAHHGVPEARALLDHHAPAYPAAPADPGRPVTPPREAATMSAWVLRPRDGG